jgi:hypothetical protein
MGGEPETAESVLRDLVRAKPEEERLPAQKPQHLPDPRHQWSLSRRHARHVRIVIVHAFLKKTRTTPRRDRAIARQRVKEIQRG